ncbi:MAG: hypothetical protein ACE5IL_10585 [Myxococcota bacterium]
MDLVPYLSAVILASTIATIVLALFSYAAFKLRNHRRPHSSGEAPVFFDRILLDHPAAPAAEDEP